MYEITSDPAHIDLQAAHAFLSKTYWSLGIPIETLARAVENSICFAARYQNAQVGFARVITDRATFGYLADVYVLEEHRGKGVSKKIMGAVVSHPDLQGLRRFLLATRDAHSLYTQFGFKPLAAPDRMMEILNSNVYQRQG
jgi:GNAT superfamily N-acetyltransferase